MLKQQCEKFYVLALKQEFVLWAKAVFVYCIETYGDCLGWYLDDEINNKNELAFLVGYGPANWIIDSNCIGTERLNKLKEDVMNSRILTQC